MGGVKIEVDSDKTKLIIDFVLKELDYRREKQWKIFSWASTLLTAIVGGVVALKTHSPRPFTYPILYRGALSLTVLALTLYACGWITHFLLLEIQARDALEEYTKDADIKFVKPNQVPFFNYLYAICLLSIAALLVIWI
jgi:hypothetical protein